jgi:hypothetical protein
VLLTHQTYLIISLSLSLSLPIHSIYPSNKHLLKNYHKKATETVFEVAMAENNSKISQITGKFWSETPLDSLFCLLAMLLWSSYLVCSKLQVPSL